MSKAHRKRKTRQLKDLPAGTTYTLRIVEWAADGGFSCNRSPTTRDQQREFWTLHEGGTASHHSIGLWLGATLADPPIKGIDEVHLTLHREWTTPGSGVLDRRSDLLRGYYFLPECVLLALLIDLSTGQQIYLQCTGTRLFRRSAILDHIEWHTASHPDLLAELEGVPSPPP